MKLSLSHWYPGLGVVIDCIDSYFCPLSYFAHMLQHRRSSQGHYDVPHCKCYPFHNFCYWVLLQDATSKSTGLRHIRNLSSCKVSICGTSCQEKDLQTLRSRDLQRFQPPHSPRFNDVLSCFSLILTSIGPLVVCI